MQKCDTIGTMEKGTLLKTPRGRSDVKMPIQYKIDVIAALKEAGYNTTRIRKEKIMGEAMLQKIRNNQMVSWATLETICSLLDCQPGDLLEYVKEAQETLDKAQ